MPLFIAMITIGMALGGDDTAYQLAMMIHEKIRWKIYSSPSFRTPAKLWEMQALLLRELFDKMLSTRRHHEMAHIVSLHCRSLPRSPPHSFRFVSDLVLKF